MSAGGVITEFLASVGFKADEKSLKASLAKVAAFGATVQLMAAGIYAGLAKVASGEAAMARQAEQLGTTSDKLQELGYVAEQSGSSIDAVTRSMESLVSKNPRIKDAATALERAGDRMARMSDAQRKAYADNMGIDRSLIPMLISDTGKLTEEFRAMYAVAGYDAREAGKASKEFMGEIGKLTTMVGLLAKSVALAFIGRIRHDVANLRKVIMENFDKIKRIFEGAIKIVLRIAAVISALVYRVISWISALMSWYDKLDDGQKKVVVGIGLLLAAWKLLNAGFLATPLGLIITGLLGIVALVDDYLTYMEGGESYFDWGPWADSIETARAALSKVISAVGGFVTEHQGLIQSLAKGMALFFGLKKAVGVVGLLSGAFKALNLVIKANPIGLLLSLLCMAAMLVIDNWDEVKAFFIGLWESIQAKAAACADFFTGIWQGVKDWFVSLWAGVTDAFPDMGAWAARAVKSMREMFGAGIQWIKDKINSLTGFLPDWVKKKMGLKPGEDNPGGGQGDDPDFDLAVNNALAASRAASAPVLTPSPAQAASMNTQSTQEVNMNAKTEIHIQTSDPIAAGNQAADRQAQVNADTVRHMKGAVR